MRTLMMEKQARRARPGSPGHAERLTQFHRKEMLKGFKQEGQNRFTPLKEFPGWICENRF